MQTVSLCNIHKYSNVIRIVILSHFEVKYNYIFNIAHICTFDRPKVRKVAKGVTPLVIPCAAARTSRKFRKPLAFKTSTTRSGSLNRSSRRTLVLSQGSARRYRVKVYKRNREVRLRFGLGKGFHKGTAVPFGRCG